ncbi:uncharacterized protein LOC129582364 [Paramacrobiotus metropolitanus]|uniref:uncharacterized protein LOC129582364 n=1 Tax=Paramacrobiotus metropolitanus TaxID=2943436 RepID=UPI002446359F|nr:uncharacterized protein LOC129582364 [Paramacrobiotus metropolitanus]
MSSVSSQYGARKVQHGEGRETVRSRFPFAKMQQPKKQEAEQEMPRKIDSGRQMAFPISGNMSLWNQLNNDEIVADTEIAHGSLDSYCYNISAVISGIRIK